MPFSLNIKSVILVFFFINGIIFTILLLRKGREVEKPSSLWMSLFIFTCSLYISPWMFGYAGWYGMDGFREFLFFAPTQHYFLLGPVILFYSKTLLSPIYVFKRIDRLHFIPAALYILSALIMFFVDALILDSFYFYADGRDKDFNSLYQIIGTAHVVIYLILSTKMYYNYRLKIYNELSFADAVTYKWFKRFLIALLIILVARVIFLIIYPNWGDFGAKFWYYFIFSALFYYIALMAYTNSITLSIPFTMLEEELLPSKQQGKSFEDLSNKKKELEQMMKSNSLYRNSTLALVDVSEALGISKEQVSIIINHGFNVNFNDYVNSYRIEEIEKRFQGGDISNFTILGIALDSGFNSKTTFNRAFKKHTGLTPIQYLKNLEK